MKYAVAGAVVTAAVSTIGDYLWANVIPHRVVVYWFAHAIVLFATIGACLGLPSRKPIVGAAACIVIGCSATLSYWFLQPLLGYAGAMFFLFCGMWLAIGVLTGRILERRDSMQTVVIRSTIAALGSGVGFYAISGIWMPFDPHGWDYLRHFLSWIVAYLPAFAALLGTKSRNHKRVH